MEIGAWLHIGESGDVTVYTGKVEVGQNARTSLTQAVVEELHAPVASVHMVMARHRPHAVRHGHGGQHDHAAHVAADPQAAAAAREMLLDLAAQKWSVDRATLKVADGKVSAGARSAGFGELTRGEKLDPHDSGERGAGAGERNGRPPGTSLPKVNGHAIVTGAHKYTYDLKRPGMLYARCSIRRNSAPR